MKSVGILDAIGRAYRTDKSSPYHNYLNVYEQYFQEFGNKPVVLLELGIGDINSENREGESILMWREYFYSLTGNQAKCYAIDNDPVKVGRNTDCFVCAQTDKEGLNQIISLIGIPDIIVDDASHIRTNTIDSFEILFPLLKSGGYYCIEDVVAPSYWPNWGGSENIFDSKFMNYFFVLVHSMNLKRQETFNPPQDIDVPNWIKEIDSIHFHHSQIIIKKK